MLLIYGVGELIFGLLFFGRPGCGLQSLVILFGCYCLADGFGALGSALTRGEPVTWWSMLFAGLVSIVAGVTAVLWPGLTVRVLLVIIATWSILRGALEIAGARELARTVPRTRLLAVAGGAALLFGALLLARPGAGELAVGRMSGAFAAGHGLLLIAFSLRLRGWLYRPAMN